MIILVDCDGPLADFVGATIELLRAEFGDACTLTASSQVTKWGYLKELPQKQKRFIYDKLESGETWAMYQPTPGAQQAIESLRIKGHKVYCVTSPWSSCPTWDYERRRWLKRLFDIEGPCVITTEAKYLVRGDVFIDDKPEHVRGWQVFDRVFDQNLRPSSLLFDLPHNQGCEGFVRARWIHEGIMTDDGRSI